MTDLDKQARELLDAACIDDAAVDSVNSGDPYIAKNVAAYAIRAALTAAPEGYRMVRGEPTDDMLIFLQGRDLASARRAYALMLAAAKEPKND